MRCRGWWDKAAQGAGRVTLASALVCACGGTGNVDIPPDEGGADSAILDSQPDRSFAVDASADASDVMSGGDRTMSDSPTDTGIHDDVIADSPAETDQDAPLDSTPDSSPDSPFDSPPDSPSDTSVDGPSDAPSEAASCPTTCVPPVPAGWTGPVEWTQGASPPACSSSYKPTYTGNADLVYDPATCSACTCSDPSVVTCSSVTATFFADDTCMTACSTAAPVTLADGACTDVTAALATCPTKVPMTTVYTSISAPTVTAGSCAASKVVATRPTPTWGDVGYACSPATAPTTTGCASGDLCAPALDPMYHSCILRSGVHACPTTGYTAQHVEYGGYTDGRSCTACGCGDVSASACAPSTVDTYVIAGCTGAVGATYTPLPDACAAVPDFTRSFEFESEVDPKAGCAPSGGAPEGSVTPTEPTTLCCQP